MQYSLTEEQLMLQDMIGRLAKEKIAPGAAERDEKGEFAADMVELFRENGLFAADFPKEYGGEEMGLLALCLIIEEVAKACASSSLILAVHELGTMPIFLAGNKEQKDKYFPKLATGEYLAAFGLTEPNAGSDVSGLTTKAVRDGDTLSPERQKNFYFPRGCGASGLCGRQNQPGGPRPQGNQHVYRGKGDPGLYHRQA